jgi:hypothetical protein
LFEWEEDIRKLRYWKRYITSRPSAELLGTFVGRLVGRLVGRVAREAVGRVARIMVRRKGIIVRRVDVTGTLIVILETLLEDNLSMIYIFVEELCREATDCEIPPLRL